jgi:hypothetical protein
MRQHHSGFTSTCATRCNIPLARVARQSPRLRRWCCALRGNTLVLSQGQAAKAVGRSKSALSRDVKAGRISANRNADGSLAIEPSELFRVFRRCPTTVPATACGAIRNPSATGLRQWNGSATTLRNGRPIRCNSISGWRRPRPSGIYYSTRSPICARLDREGEERRRLIAVLTVDRRPPWWRRWFR